MTGIFERVQLGEEAKYKCPECGYIGGATFQFTITDVEHELVFGPYCMVCIGRFLERKISTMEEMEQA